MTAGDQNDVRAWLRAHAPWLLAPELALCAVGSSALAEACRRRGLPGPAPKDLDLAWTLAPEAGAALLRERGVLLPTSPASQARGTLALRVDARRVEITSLRGARRGSLQQQIEADLAARDMTIGALAWWLAEDRLLDPLGGLEHWQQRRIVPAGDPATRIREHPVRWLRYYRRAAQWGFALERTVRALPADASLLASIPPEALAAELREALLACPSPGRFLLELHEARLLAPLLPELMPQFDGRPAGPVRHHPEVSQALHLILALEWLGARNAHLDESDRVTAATAVLCHDLGKGLTPAAEMPAHRGHEASGAKLLDALLERLPGLVDAAGRRLAHAVARLHLVVRDFTTMRRVTLVDLHDRWFRQADFRVDLFALAVGADVGGRLGREAEGEQVARQVEADLRWLRERCASVDARVLREAHPNDHAAFKDALRRKRAAALRRP